MNKKTIWIIVAVVIIIAIVAYMIYSKKQPITTTTSTTTKSGLAGLDLGNILGGIGSILGTKNSGVTNSVNASQAAASGNLNTTGQKQFVVKTIDPYQYAMQAAKFNGIRAI